MINFANGRDVLTAYRGEPQAQRLIQQDLVQPLALASTDIDEDGVPDLLTGYGSPGGGLLTLHRGNIDSIYPTTVAANQRKADGSFTDAPFLSPALAVGTPGPVDWIGCGDFDADGHSDVVTAAKGSTALYYFTGDGNGHLRAIEPVNVPGRITALVAGEINRADGVTDLAVGISGTDGPKVLVFEAPDGALRARPQVYSLAYEAGALGLGHLDDDPFVDLAVASGRELLIVHGQARRRSLDGTNPAEAPSASIERRFFSFAISSLAIGDFSGNHHVDLALLTPNGTVHLLSRPHAGMRKPARSRLWLDEVVPGSWPGARLLMSAHVSGMPADDLLVIDSRARQVQLIARTRARKSQLPSLISETLDVDGEPIAVLPMRLNGDAQSDLVILRRNHTSPSVVTTAPTATFIVDSVNDSGVGSLRQAIIDANANVGADEITFNIGGGGAQLINVLSQLPDITEPVTIDATTQSGFAGSPLIELAGNATPMSNGLVVSGGGTAVRGLVINLFDLNGIMISGSGNNIIENCFIGTSQNGLGPAGNLEDGVVIDGTSGDTIGGTTAAASNLISGNGIGGVRIQAGASNTLVQGNVIGMDRIGAMPVVNTFGIVVDSAMGVTIGGAASGASNLISGNFLEGILVRSGSSGSLIQGNLVGTDITGTAGPGNSGSGIKITSGANNNMVGGITPGASNTIAFNSFNGVMVDSGSNNAILSNSILLNGGVAGLGIDLTDDLSVTPNDSCDVDIGPNGVQNFPILTSAQSNGVNTVITGSLNSTASTLYRIEFFSNLMCDSSGFGQGGTLIGSTSVTTDAFCDAPINVMFSIALAPGQVVTATATDSLGNTSEFSQCVTVTAATGADLEITVSDSPDPVISGDNLTYAIVITNNGPDPDPDVMFTDTVPPGTTFVSLASPGTCTTPPVGGTGLVTCSLGPLSGGASVPLTLTVNVTAAPGAVITNSATVSGMGSDPNLANNSTTSSTGVFSGSCTVICPPDLFVGTSPTSSSCGTVVTFSPTVFGCEEVICVPPPGSVFAIGTTSVSCTEPSVEILGPLCTFNITVIDQSPPSLSCSTGVTVPLPAGQTSAVVNYPSPAVSDCSSTSVVCVPPSGSTFPAGATLVTCTAIDAFENINRCFFLASVVDSEPPVITCPANVSVLPPAGQASAVVNYPPPTVSDNFPGINIVCSPASGSSFPVGSTTVTCTATDTGGSQTSCSFIVGVGQPGVKVTIPGNKPAVEFEAQAARKPPKPNKNPCTFFTIQNIGFSPLVLTFDSLKRTGSDVTNGRISDPNDVNGVAVIAPLKFFTLYLENFDQTLTQLGTGSSVTIQPGQAQPFCLKFAPYIPGLAGKTTGLAATDALPDLVTSTIVFRQNSGANIDIPILASVATGVVLVNPVNPRKPAIVNFARSGNEITVSYAVFDSNLDVTRTRYEFLDGSGQVAAGPFEIDLAASISSVNLVRGQSFSVEQRFTGAASNPEITSVRVTVFDGETSASATSTSSANSISLADVQLMNSTRRVTLYPPVVRLR
jgi:uncharacterized repeat protein (TIGR01451 family)